MIVAGLDTRFSFSVAGVQVRRAMRRGGRLVAVDARESNLARVADDWLRSAPGDEAPRAGSACCADGPARATAVAAALAAQAARRCVRRTAGLRLRRRRGAAARARGARRRGPASSMLPLAHGANVRGALELGGLARRAARPAAGAGRGGPRPRRASGRPPCRSVLYLVGEAPFADPARLRARDRPGTLSAALRGRRVPAGGISSPRPTGRSPASRGASRSCAPSSTVAAGGRARLRAPRLADLLRPRRPARPPRPAVRRRRRRAGRHPRPRSPALPASSTARRDRMTPIARRVPTPSAGGTPARRASATRPRRPATPPATPAGGPAGRGRFVLVSEQRLVSSPRLRPRRPWSRGWASCTSKRASRCTPTISPVSESRRAAR